MKKRRIFYHFWRNADQKKIRIGYLSPYFCFHGMMQLGIVFLSNYDKERFEVFVYMYGKADEVSGYLEDRVQGWRNISRCTADEAARCIYEDSIDILVDISGNAEGRAIPILERKPAPIQMAGIGYCESTKCPVVDYFLGDVFVDNDETEKAFREELLILPQSHLCYTPACRSTSVVEFVRHSGETVTFAGIGSLAEIKKSVLSAWARILGQVQGARLVFMAEDYESGKQRRRALRQMELAGIDLVRVEVRAVPESCLVDFARIDIVLDADSRWNGCIFCDALYMGVPVVTWNGTVHRERLGKSILENVGLGDLCAGTGAEYAEKAVMLARDRELLSAIRKNLRGMMEKSSLMDGKSYMESLEQGFQMVWKHFVSSQRVPSTQEMERLVAVMDELIEAGEKKQVVALAELISMLEPQSMELKLKLLNIFLTKGTDRNLEKAIPLFPAESLYGKFLRARSYFKQKNWTEAKRLCQELVAQGSLPYPLDGAGYRFLAEIFMQLGDMAEAAKLYRFASNSKDMCLMERMGLYSGYLSILQYLPQSPKFMYQEAKYFRVFLKDIKHFSHGWRKSHTKLHVGYISPDFKRHVVACFIQAFFYAADRDRFEIYGYANCEEDDISQKIRKTSDYWRNVLHCDAEETARIIYGDEIDILVELAGHTVGNALPVMAFRPAPIQICGIGYFATTGLSCVDYFMVDNYTALQNQDVFFSEKLLRLPHSHFCYKQVLGIPDICSDLPCERNGFITFGSMNNVNKISDETLQIWGKLMEKIPDGHLFLKHGTLDEAERCRQERERMWKAGIDLSRVTIEGFSGDYLKEYSRIDIALDTFPYPGGGTTCDALYMGVPVVTLAGNSHHERFGLSILSNIGLENLCARTEEEYVDIAVGLARNRTYLKELHASLRGRMEQSPVMDQKLYMKDLEAAYEEIWKKYEEGK